MTDQLSVRLFSRAVDVFREVDANAPLCLLTVFLLIAQEPGMTGRDLIKKSGISQAAVSRYTLTLGEFSDKKGEVGLLLVERVDDRNDLRLKRFFLTPSGKALIIKILKALDPTGPEPNPDNFPTYHEWMKSGAR